MVEHEVEARTGYTGHNVETLRELESGERMKFSCEVNLQERKGPMFVCNHIDADSHRSPS